MSTCSLRKDPGSVLGHEPLIFSCWCHVAEVAHDVLEGVISVIEENISSNVCPVNERTTNKTA
eukprot:7300980-Prorocentrum_lima.AAC.1